MVNEGSNYVFGFCEREYAKRNQIYISEGLAFSVSVITNPEKFDVVIKNRGYYKNSKLHFYGE